MIELSYSSEVVANFSEDLANSEQIPHRERENHGMISIAKSHGPSAIMATQTTSVALDSRRFLPISWAFCPTGALTLKLFAGCPNFADCNKRRIQRGAAWRQNKIAEGRRAVCGDAEYDISWRNSDLEMKEMSCA